MQLDRSKILQAEAPAEDRCVGQVLLRLVRQSGGAALDQRAHRRREQASGISRERPHTVRLLNQSHLPVRPGQLLDDECDALRLCVHGRRARYVDLPAEDLLGELGRLQLREPLELQAAHHPHPLHVGDESHGFVHHGQLFRTGCQPDEDRRVRVGADDVAEHPHAVLVRPLEVVDQYRYGAGGCQRADGDGCEIEYAKELVIRRQGLECRIVSARDGVEHPLDLLSCAVAAVFRCRGGEEAAGEEKRSPDLLVGCCRERREAFCRRELRCREEEPRLADAGLPLERECRQPPGSRGGELLSDRAELDLPPDHGPRSPSGLKGKWGYGRCGHRSGVRVTHASNVRESSTAPVLTRTGLWQAHERPLEAAHGLDN